MLFDEVYNVGGFITGSSSSSVVHLHPFLKKTEPKNSEPKQKSHFLMLVLKEYIF